MSGFGGLNKSANGVVIGLVQLQLPTVKTKADLTAQTQRVCDMVGKARRNQGTMDLVVFPEYSLHGLSMDTSPEIMCELDGPEVKALRQGEGSIAEAYAELKDGQMWLVNANIPEFSHGNRHNHEPKRPRKLLLHARQISKMNGAVTRQGMTLIPLMIYFNDRGRAKVELALAKGKKLHDKRDTEKARDWKRDAARIMRERG